MTTTKNISPYNANGEEHGYWERYYPNDQLRYKGNWVNGKRDGYWERYYSNGQLACKGDYKANIRDGYWGMYDMDGELKEQHYFIN